MKHLATALIFWLVGLSGAAAQTAWQRQDSPVSDDLHNIYFADNSEGWIITHQTGRVLHTVDGGQEWKIQADLDSLTLESIHFVNRDTGWISGEKGLLFHTTDGGASWEMRRVADSDSWIYGVYFINSMKGLAVGLRPGANMLEPVFQKTADGGDRWVDASDEMPQTGFEAIHFSNFREGYLAGFGHILYTGNGGDSWSVQFTDTTSNTRCRFIRGLGFSKRGTGIAVGHCGMVLRTENGKTWDRQEPFTGNRLRDVAFINSSDLLIVGDRNREPGVLYRSGDGGRSWQRVPIHAPDLHHIAVTDRHIWLVGDNGTILKKKR